MTNSTDRADGPRTPLYRPYCTIKGHEMRDDGFETAGEECIRCGYNDSMRLIPIPFWVGLIVGVVVTGTIGVMLYL